MYFSVGCSLVIMTLLPLCSRGNPVRSFTSTGRCTARLRSGTIDLGSLGADGERSRFVTSFAGVRFTFTPCVPSDDENKSHIEATIISTNRGPETSSVDLGTWKTVSIRYPGKVFCHRRHTPPLTLEQCPLSWPPSQGRQDYVRRRERRLLAETPEADQNEEDISQGNSASLEEDSDAEDNDEDDEDAGMEEDTEKGYRDRGDDIEQKEEEEKEDRYEENGLSEDLLQKSGPKLYKDYPGNVTAVLKLDTKGNCRGLKMFVLLQCKHEVIRSSETNFRVVHSQCRNKLHFLLSHRCFCEGECHSVTNVTSDKIITTPGVIAGGKQLVGDKKNTSKETLIVGNVTLTEVLSATSDNTMPKYLWLIVVVNLALLAMAVIIGGICCRINSSSQESYGYFPDFMSIRQEALRSSRLTMYSSKESCHSVPAKPTEYLDYTSLKALLTDLPQLNNCVIPSRDLDLGPRLGGGLFGDTYIAEWNDRTLAAKRITVGIHKNQLTDELYHWLVTEVKALSKQRHKYLGAVIGICIETRQPYVLTEFIDGDTLKCLLEESQRPIKWHNKLKIYTQVAEGLQYLHYAKPSILHRDLRCANIIIDKYDRAKIVDFGMIKLIHRMRQLCDGRKGCFCNKELSAVPASVRWTAPEILRNPQADENGDVITKACDVYSFGIVMWEIASHCDPYDDITDEDEVMQLVIEGARPTSTKVSGMIRPLQDLMTLCWDPNPEKRPSIKQVLNKLKNCHQMIKKS